MPDDSAANPFDDLDEAPPISGAPNPFDDLDEAPPISGAPNPFDDLDTASWDSRSWLNKAGNQLRSGAELGTEILNTNRAAAAATGLDNIAGATQRWDEALQTPPEETGPGWNTQAYRRMFRGPDAAQQGRMAGIVQDANRNAAAAAERRAEIPSSPHAANLAAQVNAGEYGQAWETFKANPGDIAGQTIIGSWPVIAGAAAAPLAVGALGMGTLPMLLAQFGGSVVTRLSSNTVQTIAQQAQSEGVNLQDPDAVARWMVDRPDSVRAAVTKAGQGALAAAVVDTIAMGFTRPVVPGAGLRTNAGALAQDFAAGAIQAPASAAANQLGMEGEITNPGEIAVAGTAGLFQGATNAAIRSVDAAGRARIPLNYRAPGQPGIEPATPPAPQIPGPPGAPAGGGAAATPPAPAPRPAPPAGPAGGQPSAAPLQPGDQVIVNGRPATVRYTAEDGATAVVATDPSNPATFQAVPVATLERPTSTIPGFGEIAGGGMPRPPTAPEAFAAGLEEAISPVVQQQRAQRIAQFQETLPPGFTITQVPGGYRLVQGDELVWDIAGFPTEEDFIDMADTADVFANYQPPGTPVAPTIVTRPEHIDTAASVINQEPTPGQAEAGNYQKGHVRIGGLDITIENPAGSIRSGTAPDGTEWQDEQPAHYGYIKRTSGMDGDQIDVYLGPQADQAHRMPVFIIDQIEPASGKPDEHKAMLGFPTQQAAVTAYHAAFGDGSGEDRMGAVSQMPWGQFRQWAKGDNTKAPVAYQPPDEPDAPDTITLRRRRRVFRAEGPVTLLEFLALAGGIRDPRGDLKTMEAQRHFIPAVGALVRGNGRSLDYAREIAVEAGYLKASGDISDLLEAIDQELRGQPVYSGADIAEAMEAKQGAKAEREWAAINREIPALRTLASQRGYDLNKDEITAAAYFVVHNGMGGDEALAAAAVYSAWVLEQQAAQAAPSSFQVEAHELDVAAETLGLDLTAEQHQEAYDLWMAGWPVLRAVWMAGAYRPAEQAEEEIIPFEAGDTNGGRSADGGPGLGSGGQPGEEPEQAALRILQAHAVRRTPKEFYDNGMIDRDLRAGVIMPDGGLWEFKPDYQSGSNQAGAHSQFQSDVFADSTDHWTGYAPVTALGSDSIGIGTATPSTPRQEQVTRALASIFRRAGALVQVDGQGGLDGGAGSGDSGPELGSGGQPGEPPPDTGGPATGADQQPAGRPEAGGDQSSDGNRPDTRPDAGPQAVPEPKPAGGGATPRPGRPVAEPDPALFPELGEQGTDAGQTPRPVGGGKPAQGPQADIGGIFGNGGQQTDITDAIKTTRDVGNIAGPKMEGLAKAFAEEFAAGKAYPNINAARKQASEWLGGPVQAGTRQAKVVDEAIELAAVLRAREIVREGDDAGAHFDALLRLYQNQMPTLGVRTSDSIERQAYSTPLPLAYAASRLAGVRRTTYVYEPTAGNGALLIEAEPSASAVNELDPERRSALELQGFDRVTANDATTYAPPNGVRALVANPPFGSVGDTAHIEHVISLKALSALDKTGRAVLIVAGPPRQAKGESARRTFYRNAANRSFYSTLYGDFRVTDHFTVAGELYAKQGAAWPVDVIVIEGRGKSSRALPAADVPRIVSDWADLKEMAVNAPTNPWALAVPAPAGPDSVEPGSGSSGGAGGSPSAARPTEAPDDRQLPDVDERPGGMDDTEGAGPTGRGDRPGADAGEGGTVGPADAVPDAATVGGGAGAGERPAGEPAGGTPGTEGPATAEPGGERGGDTADDIAGVDGRDPDTAAGGDNGLSDQQQADLAKPPADLSEQDPEPEGAVEQKSQVPYKPLSRNESVDTLAPVNIADAMAAALRDLEAKIGKPIDDWVMEELGYTHNEFLRTFSGEQVDALALAIQQIKDGKGFIIGDQTGVGKGRFVAGLIRYALRNGLTPIFATEKPNLYKDIARDLKDIGYLIADIASQTLMTNSGERIPLTDDPDGPVLKSPENKRHKETLATVANERKLPAGKNKVFTTYSQMQQYHGKDTERQNMLRAIAPKSFLILDESHNAGSNGAKERPVKNRDGTYKVKRSKFIRDLVAAATSVAFSSATWAKRPDVLDLYGAKTDMREAVENLENLAEAITLGGVPMQQIVSAQLARVGQFSRREKSLDGVPYDQVLVPVDRKTYNDNASLMRGIFRFYEDYVRPAIEEIRDETDKEGGAVGADSGVGTTSISSVGFGATMHNVVAQMLLAGKADEVVNKVIAAVQKGEKPVVTLANTMEKMLNEHIEGIGAKRGDTIDLTFNDVLMRYLKRQLRYTVKGPHDEKGVEYWLTLDDLAPGGAAEYRRLEKVIRAADLAAFPASPIDYIRDTLEKSGIRTGEITGRETRVRYRGDGKIELSHRPGKETSVTGKNVTISGFNNGTIDVLVLNQSGATGLSLHSHYAFGDTRPRVMFIAQAEADIAIHMQVLGRVHRTGQVTLPRFEQVIADVPAEKRPAAVLAKKMASLSASTTGARRGLLGSKQAIDFMNKYGGQVTEQFMAENPEIEADLGLNLGISDDGESALDEEAVVRKVTGRLPLLDIEVQERVYDAIESAYAALIEELDAAGENALEAKTLDLRAKTLESYEVKAGKPGNNPFTAPVVFEQVDVRRTTKPPTPRQVLQMLATGLGAHSAYIPEGAEIDVYAALWNRMAADGVAQGESLQQDVHDATQAAKLQVRVRFKDPEARQKHTDAAEAAGRQIRSILEYAPVGATVDIAAADGPAQRAVVVRITVDKKAANPAAPSAWEWIFLTDDGLSRRIPASQILLPGQQPSEKQKETARTIEPAPNASKADFLASLKEMGANAREQRIMVTGNLLAGFAMQQGQIVHYTDAKGQIRQGILLSRSFNVERFMAGQAQVLRGDHALRWIQDRAVSPPPFIESSDGLVRVVATDKPDIYFVEAPKSKQEGAKFWGNRDVAGATENGFISAGDKMRGRVPTSRLRAMIAALEAVLRRDEAYFQSTHPAAKGWAQKAGIAAAAAASAVKGLARDQSGGFDMDAFINLLPEPTRRWLQNQIPGLGSRVMWGLKRAFGRTTSITPPGVAMPAIGRAPASGVTTALKTPRWRFHGTGLADIIDEGITAEENQATWNTRLEVKYETIKRDLNKAGGSYAAMQEAMFAADGREIPITDTQAINELFEEFGLAPSEQRAFRQMHRFMESLARLHDNHERSMLPQVQQDKARAWRKLERFLRADGMSKSAARKMMTERSRLATHITRGTGDVVAASLRLEEINGQLGELVARNPDEIGGLIDRYDRAEARLASKGVRGRRAGYVPHKFFGGYRLFRWEEPEAEDEEGRWREITSDQGFYNTWSQALTAAQQVYQQSNDPDGVKLRIMERSVKWPETFDGTELTDRSYFRFMAHLRDAMPDADDAEIREAAKGVARRRFRRRIYAPGLFRKGYAGFSEDLDRVMKVHIQQTVRYVVMDKLKSKVINREEALGFSRADAVLSPEDQILKKDLAAWWRDVNGTKQDLEKKLDHYLLSPKFGPGFYPLALAASTFGLSLAAGFNLPSAYLVSTYAGYRLYRSVNGTRSLKDIILRRDGPVTGGGGQFPFRKFQQDILSDMAHAKLGLVFNLRSAAVNLTQTITNTYPILGEKWTAVGIQRAARALLDQSRGIQSPDARLLQRANIFTSWHVSEADQVLLGTDESKFARWSLFAFQSIETANRAVAYFGGYEREMARSNNAAKAHNEGGKTVVRVTQFHYGNANKPPILRYQASRTLVQFKNFMLQQIAFVFHEAPRHVSRQGGKFLRDFALRLYIGLFMVAGAVGLPGMQQLDQAISIISDKFQPGRPLSILDEIKRATIDAEKYGWGAGAAARVFAWGLPGVFTSFSTSVGMGDRFLPTSVQDAAGPTFGTLMTWNEAQQKGADLVDQLTTLTPAARPLKALEAAANGMPMTRAEFWKPQSWQQHTLTDWRRKGAPIYHPSIPQLFAYSFGFTPIEVAQMQAMAAANQREDAARRGKADRVLSEIVFLSRAGRNGEIGKVLTDARESGLYISDEMVTRALRDATLDAAQRDLLRSPLRLRGERSERTNIIRDRLSPAERE